MVKMCELSINDRGLLVEDINGLMSDKYKIGGASVREFWETLEIGIKAREIA